MTDRHHDPTRPTPATTEENRAMTDRPDPPIKTPAEWCAELGVTVLDPDGWRATVGQYAPRSWTDPISAAEFHTRLNVSTVRVPPPAIDEAYFLDPATSLMPPTVPALGRHVATTTTAEWLADQRPWLTLETEAWTALHERYARPTNEEAQP